MHFRNDYYLKVLSQYFDKILFAIAFTYLVFVSLWLVSSGKLKSSSVSHPQNSSVTQKQALSPSDAEFIAYMQRSLAAIDRQIATNQPQNPIASPVKVPPAPVAVRTSPTVIERIYVPLYPSNQPSVAVNSPTLPPPTPPAPISSVPVLTPGAKLLPPPTPTSPPTATTSYTLVGLLASSDRSYALFDINGIAQRIELNQEIGTSGWHLISVQDTKVVINRKGQQRYIEVGQKF